MNKIFSMMTMTQTETKTDSIVGQLFNRFSIKNVSDVGEINEILNILSEQFGELCSDWKKKEREELITVWNFVIERGLNENEVIDEVENEMKSIAQSIEKEVTKNLMISGFKTMLGHLFG